MIEAIGETLRLSAALICDGHGHPVDDAARAREVQESTVRLDRLMDLEIDSEVTMLIDDVADGSGALRLHSTRDFKHELWGLPPRWWLTPL